MAHNLNFNEQTGKHSFMSVKERAWHGLGTIVENYPTSEEALHFAGLDFTVDKRPLVTLEGVEVPAFFATMRTDNNKVLGVVGKDYRIVQNRDAFTFFDSIVGGEGIMYETAGALGNGEKIFITAKLPGYIKVGQEDLIDKYLFLTTSHDGSGSITAAFTPIRIVCNNTLNAAMKNHTNAVKIRHTANAKERLEQAHKIMGITNSLSANLEDIFNRWTKIRITDMEVKKLIQLALVPSKEVLKNIQAGKDDELSTMFNNKVNAAYEYAMGNDTQQLDTTKGTLFGAYNGVTGYYQNVAKFKDDEAKTKSLLYGGIAQTNAQASFNLCSQYEEKGNSFLMN